MIQYSRDQVRSGCCFELILWNSTKVYVCLTSATVLQVALLHVLQNERKIRSTMSSLGVIRSAGFVMWVHTCKRAYAPSLFVLTQ
jgi:hypothetical protein